jgi:hypothetical protein
MWQISSIEILFLTSNISLFLTISFYSGCYFSGKGENFTFLTQFIISSLRIPTNGCFKVIY